MVEIGSEQGEISPARTETGRVESTGRVSPEEIPVEVREASGQRLERLRGELGALSASSPQPPGPSLVAEARSKGGIFSRFRRFLTEPTPDPKVFSGQLRTIQQTFPEYVSPQRVEELKARSFFLTPISAYHLSRKRGGFGILKSVARAIVGSGAYDLEEDKIYDNSFPQNSLGTIFAVEAILFSYPVVIFPAILAALQFGGAQMARWHEATHAVSYREPRSGRLGLRKGKENKAFDEVVTIELSIQAAKNDLFGRIAALLPLTSRQLEYGKAKRIFEREVKGPLVMYLGKDAAERLVKDTYFRGDLEKFRNTFDGLPNRGPKTFKELSRQADESLPSLAK